MVNAVEQHRTGYLVKVGVMFFLMLLDIVANSIVDHFQPSYNKLVPLIISAVQLFCQLMTLLIVFLLAFGTYLFQVGLLGLLTKYIKPALYVLPLYFVVTGGLLGFRVAKNVMGYALWSDPGFIAVSIIQKIVALFYYIILIHTTVQMGDPQLYLKAPWIKQYRAQTLNNA